MDNGFKNCAPWLGYKELRCLPNIIPFFSGNPGLKYHRGSYLGKCCARHLVSIIFNLHRILEKQLLFSHGNYKSQRMRLVSKASLPEDGNEVQLTLK